MLPFAQCAGRSSFVVAVPSAGRVLRPCTRPSAIVFTTSWLKMASKSLASGVHPILRNFSSLVNVYVKHFLFRLQACERILKRASQNVFNNVYTILMHCYLFHHLTTPSPTLLHITMQKSSLLSHDFIAWMRKSSRWLHSTVSVHLGNAGGVVPVLKLTGIV